MEEGEAKHEESMKTLTNNMTALSNVIANGFGMLQGLMYQPRFVITPHLQGNHGMPSYGQHQHPSAPSPAPTRKVFQTQQPTILAQNAILEMNSKIGNYDGTRENEVLLDKAFLQSSFTGNDSEKAA